MPGFASFSSVAWDLCSFRPRSNFILFCTGGYSLPVEQNCPRGLSSHLFHTLLSREHPSEVHEEEHIRYSFPLNLQDSQFLYCLSSPHSTFSNLLRSLGFFFFILVFWFLVAFFLSIYFLSIWMEVLSFSWGPRGLSIHVPSLLGVWHHTFDFRLFVYPLLYCLMVQENSYVILVFYI